MICLVLLPAAHEVYLSSVNKVFVDRDMKKGFTISFKKPFKGILSNKMDPSCLFSTLISYKKNGIGCKYSIFVTAFTKNATTSVYHLYPHLQPRN